MLNKISNINLIHIGFHKTASTLLQEKIFKENKNLNLINSNENKKDLWFYKNFINVNPHEFSNEKFINEFNKKFDLEKYNNQNNKILNVLSDENLSGDPFTGLDSKLIMERINTCFENPKILIVIRNQLDMILSLFTNYINNGGTKKFKHWIKGNETRWGIVIKKLNFLPIIRNYQNIFNQKNVKVLCYENLWNSNSGLISFFKEFNIDLKLLDTNISINKGRSLFLNEVFTYVNFANIKIFKKLASKFLKSKYSKNDREFVKKVISEHLNEIISCNKELEILLKINLPRKYFD